MDTTFDLKCAKRNMLIILLVIAASILLNITAKAQTPEQWKSLKGDINLFIANDLGRNGYYEQKPVAELMGKMGEEIGPEAVIAAGDVHHFEGVISTQDPLWMTNYELDRKSVV